MAATLVLRENVDLGLGLAMRLDGLRGRDDLATLDALFFNTAEQDADVVARFGGVKKPNTAKTQAR